MRQVYHMMYNVQQMNMTLKKKKNPHVSPAVQRRTLTEKAPHALRGVGDQGQASVCDKLNMRMCCWVALPVDSFKQHGM